MLSLCFMLVHASIRLGLNVRVLLGLPGHYSTLKHGSDARAAQGRLVNRVRVLEMLVACVLLAPSEHSVPKCC